MARTAVFKVTPIYDFVLYKFGAFSSSSYADTLTRSSPLKAATGTADQLTSPRSKCFLPIRGLSEELRIASNFHHEFLES